MSVLSLGLLLPLGVNALPVRSIAMLTDAVAGSPTKHVQFIHDSTRETIESPAATVAKFLAERPLDAPLREGATIDYRPTFPVDLTIDGVRRSASTAAATVGEALADGGVRTNRHGTDAPAAGSGIVAGFAIHVSNAASWLEQRHISVAPPVRVTYDLAMAPGTRRTVSPGRPGLAETTVEVLRPDPAAAPRRVTLGTILVRAPRPKLIAEGVGERSALAGIARRGFTRTMRLAAQALSMIATAYTPSCSGCSGLTALGVRAGHGVVAVDPRLIPLGSRLFISGYGHALAGDTGGNIRGNRIDLGFDSQRAAMDFGRRPVVVYVIKTK